MIKGEDHAFNLKLNTSVPLLSANEIQLTHGSGTISNADIHWIQESPLIWKGQLSELDAGSYNAQAMLGEEGAVTNRVSIDIPHKFTLSPNPTQGKCVLRLTEAYTAPTKISIFRLDGLKIETFSLPALYPAMELNLSHLKNGTYLIRIENPDFVGQQKFIKK